MFRFQQNFKNLKSIDYASLQKQNLIASSRLFSLSTSSSKKKIVLPKINDEKLWASILAGKGTDILKYNKSYRFYRFYGDKAYNYYAMRALSLKIPNANREEFTKITRKLFTRQFLKEVAEVCELDKMILRHSNYKRISVNLGESMEAYCSGMLFNGMEEEMKKFASDVVDYYIAKEKEKKDKDAVAKKEKQKEVRNGTDPKKNKNKKGEFTKTII